MAYNQGGLTDIKKISGAEQMNMSALQTTSTPYQFGDITRANFGKGSEVAGKKPLNVAEIFLDNNAVGINPFQKLGADQGQKFHSIG